MEKPSGYVKMNTKELLKKIAEGAKKSKYRSIRTHYKGRNYDSKIEALRASELDILHTQKTVVTWSPQFIVRLTDKIEWKVDFFVLSLSSNGTLYPYLEETKGKITPDYKIKLDLYKQFGMLDLHIKMRKDSRWYTEIIYPETLKKV